jgi:UDPglucose 6-dehydrogenase
MEADVTILLTEWQEFINIHPDKFKNLMKGDWLIDTRNQFNKDEVEASGLKYIGIGHK